MNLAGRKIWQQACGDSNRDYAQLCLNLGVILNGYSKDSEPNLTCHFDRGAYIETLARGSPPFLRSLGVTPKKKQDLIRFCEEMQPGDVIVLRRGISEVAGVGIVISGYFESVNFEDVDGWYLPLGRHVSWFIKSPNKFAPYDLKLGDTTQQIIKNGAIARWLSSVPEPATPSAAPLQPVFLTGTVDVNISKIADYLFDRGIASSSIQKLVGEIAELIRIAEWYQRAKQGPSEAETIAYLVAPLLRAIGWTPQKMAIEWNKVDVALFSSLPRDMASLGVVVEVKKMHDSCLTAESQAMGYAEGKPSCNRIILTDGLRYAVFAKYGSNPFRLCAYLNLTRMRDRYPIWPCEGAQEAFRLMAPDVGILDIHEAQEQ